MPPKSCLEAWHVNTSSCVLNRDEGGYFPKNHLRFKLLADDVMSRVFQEPHFNIRSPLIMTPNWSVKTLGREGKLLLF